MIETAHADPQCFGCHSPFTLFLLSIVGSDRFPNYSRQLSSFKTRDRFFKG